MKLRKILAVSLALLMLSASAAYAHGGRGSVGVYFGPYWGPGFYSPYYYPPQVIVVPAAPPPVYIEQREAPAEAASATQQYWYYCGSSKGYYPYVKECLDGWQKVLPQPPR
ncbi:MAG TPA: hypothetical protein VLA64_08400 [Azonexus sp.]|nr:hypothetical protein [Azonexus sp.]